MKRNTRGTNQRWTDLVITGGSLNVTVIGAVEVEVNGVSQYQVLKTISHSAPGVKLTTSNAPASYSVRPCLPPQAATPSTPAEVAAPVRVATPVAAEVALGDGEWF